MQYFNFSRLINKYKSSFVSITLADGYYNESGDWEKCETTETTIEGAIISFKESKVFRAEGTLTTNDKRLFMLQPLDDKLHGLKAIYDGKVYNIEDCTENAEFTGVWAYTLRYVSAFKETVPEYDITGNVERLEKRLDGVLIDSDDPVPPDDKALTSDDVERLERRLDGELND